MQSTELQKPIFRWAGSKRKLLPTLIRYVPAHSRYVEPFVGSGCLFFALRPEGAVLGDINAELIGAYTRIRDSAELVPFAAADAAVKSSLRGFAAETRPCIHVRAGEMSLRSARSRCTSSGEDLRPSREPRLTF